MLAMLVGDLASTVHTFAAVHCGDGWLAVGLLGFRRGDHVWHFSLHLSLAMYVCSAQNPVHYPTCMHRRRCRTASALSRQTSATFGHQHGIVQAGM